MIEVKAPADLRTLQATSFFNLHRKELFYVITGLISITLLIAFGNNVLHQELVYFLTMFISIAVAAPIVIERSGLFGVSSEEFFVNAVHFALSQKKRIYLYREEISFEDEECERGDYA